MKNLIFCFFATVILLVACQEKKEPGKLVEATLTTEIHPDLNEQNCYTDLQVPDSVARQWEQAYSSYESSRGATTSDTITSPKFYFSPTLIGDLLSEKNRFNSNESNAEKGLQIDGVRVFYGTYSELTDSGPYFALYMRNVICGGLLEYIQNPVIIKATIGYGPLEGEGGRTESEDKFVLDSERWVQYRNSNYPDMPPILAYSYSWEQLSQSIEDGLSFHIGRKTIQISDGADYGEPNMEEPTEVLVNVMYFGEISSEFNGQSLLDFAKPCPIYCD